MLCDLMNIFKVQMSRLVCQLLPLAHTVHAEICTVMSYISVKTVVYKQVGGDVM